MTDRSRLAFIFDFNGVLLWDTHLHEQAWRDFSTSLRGSPLSPREMVAQVHGRVNQDILSYLLGRPVVGAELHELSEQKECLYRALCLANPAEFVLSPGAADLLEALQAVGRPRAIATSAGWENVNFYVNHLHLTRWFAPDHIIYDDRSRPSKPAPDIYLAAARRLGRPPADCLVVEDSRSGIAAAHAAGVGELVALGPISEQPHLRQLPGVTHTIARLDELRPFVVP